MFPYWDHVRSEAACANAGEFDFDAPQCPLFKGFPQPLSINVVPSGVSCTGSNSALPTTDAGKSVASPPTPPSRLVSSGGTSDADLHSTAIFTCSTVSEWIEANMSINEVKYPVLSHKAMTTGASSSGGAICSPRRDDEWVSSNGGMSPPKSSFLRGDTDFNASDDALGCSPAYNYIKMSTLKGWEPLVICRRQSVLIHIVTPETIVKKSESLNDSSPRVDGSNLFGLSNLSIATTKQSSDDSEPMTLSPRPGEDGNDADVSYEEDGLKQEHRNFPKQQIESNEDFSDLLRQDGDLPPLYVQSCSGTSLYILGTYSTAAITGCIGCEIVVGAVNGVVRLVGCERVRLTVACRKLIVVNCSECTMNIACVKPTVLIGENKALSIGLILISLTDLVG